MAQGVNEMTDAQVLAQLKLRKLKLRMELDRVEMAIKAFENIKAISVLDALPYMVDDPDEIVFDDSVMEATLFYNPSMSAEKKVLYVLSKVQFGDAAAITEYILRIDGHVKHADRFYSRITYVCSRMFKAGKIVAEKQGKKNIYRLK
ncbi:hypothetical protein A0256_11345 [Mucilaginibacter sp. PAMC 26640]|nr:hypothetical protein A0256_11345 [Mucilaginibacter sp. PAMC 26640]